ncbi:tRNA pseudouridine(55) synthase TruB [Bifidobacterium gallicum]|uniref:tRNA pseudouridine synthase B n=1 Tax=Bifidobacterium gallicum DSM 20093 = LMG 11596 TaxID=561180 RepID=D1NV99_9BIFI|nr:tRNA pseudouridine(55) synthase TruB [Bifidobacterium gallicum]EFA22750.1 tRNA pseudouridine synthase B [Bifidobacterium gallicum DSM 20093 = LMG 11596]KFI59694.1 tRNA pseudouridine synthase B [Bifidobacterium gallicum DSM 20093 = LMG 11596]
MPDPKPMTSTAVNSLPSAGVFVVDKPQGVTSHDVVAMMRQALHTKKVGHAGTLDPMATGVLVIGYGDATKLLNIIVDHVKTYRATIRFGQATMTDDAEGEIVSGVATRDVLPTLEQVEHTIRQSFIGTIDQVPNTYSAIKVHGQRAYDLARAGKDVKLESRQVTVEAFDVLDARETIAADGTPVLDVEVEVTCSAGTYIRALARDLGLAFGCGAHLTALRRLAVGAYQVGHGEPVVHAHVQRREFTNREGELMQRARAVIDEHDASRLTELVIPMEQAARRALPVIDVSAEQAQDLRYGRWLDMTSPDTVSVAIGPDHDVVALVVPARGKQLKPQTVFHA